MAVKRPRPIQSKSSLLMFDSPSEIRSVFKYFRVLVGFGSGSKCGGIPDVKDGCLSPTSPLDFKGFSRFSTGAGLGILVALDDHEPKKAMPAIVSVKLPSWNKLGKTEENGGRLCGCKEVVFEDSGAPSALSSDFLDVCYLCRRKLSHQKDIYMYRGDRAFCSEECRNQQIMSDERKERRPSSNSCSSSCSPIFTITPMAAALY